jgi:peptidyl-prolyl cis-trans isomerase SurA
MMFSLRQNVRWIWTGLFVVVIGFGLFTDAGAQAVLGIVATVNDDVISDYDVEQRMRLVLSTSPGQVTQQQIQRLRAQVLETLIDEALQIQEAGRLSIRVLDQEIQQAIKRIEEQNNLPVGGLAEVLGNAGANLTTLENQVRSQMLWSRVIARRLRPTVFVGQNEIDEVLERMKSADGLTEYLISEIFLGFDLPDQRDTAARDMADYVQQLQGGTPFEALARQVSEGISATIGGHVGWVRHGELAAELNTVLAQLSVGGISAPIETPDGFYVLLLRDKKEVSKPSDSDIQVSLKQIFIELAEDATAAESESQFDLARTVIQAVDGCSDFDALAKEMGTIESGDMGMVRLGDIPANFREAILPLREGEVSDPVRSGQGVHVFMVCERIVPEIETPDRKQVENNIGQTRLSMLARRYLRDLRRDAIIELR